MTGFNNPTDAPTGGTPPRYDYYTAPPAPPPGYPAPPANYPPPPAPRRSRMRRGRLPILVLSLLAVVGLVLIGISQLMLASARDAEQTALNTCEFNPPPNPQPGNGGECGSWRGSNIQDQASAAYSNTSATSTTLYAVGLTLAIVGAGIGTVLMVLRRMDRIEGGHNPPE